MPNNKSKTTTSTSQSKEDFEVYITSEPDENSIIITSAEEVEKMLSVALKSFDPENRKYSAYLSDGTSVSTQLTPSYIDTLADGCQNDLKKILAINSIIRKKINIDDIIGRTYESLETNVNTEYTLSYKDFKNQRNKKKTLENTKQVIDDFNELINIRSLLRKSIPIAYAEGTYITYLRGDGDNYVVDYFPLGVAEVSDYEVNGNPCVLINVDELKTRLRKTVLKNKKGKALFFENEEKEIKENYPEEVYDAYKAKDKYARLDSDRTGVIRIGNLNRRYGLSPILKAVKATLMLDAFDQADLVTSKAKSKKIIHQILRSELMGQDGDKDTYAQMAYAHDNLMKAWKMPTVVTTTPAYVEKIVYVEPKTELTNVDTVNQYRSRVMSALGISFLNTDGKQTVSTADISLTQLMKTINKISEQLEDILKRWYKIVLKDKGINVEYCPNIKIIDSELLEFEMKKQLSDFLFTKLGASYHTAYKMVGIDVGNEKQLREQENLDGLEDIFSPRLTSFNISGDDIKNDGRPIDKKSKNPVKQDYDKTRNNSKTK